MKNSVIVERIKEIFEKQGAFEVKIEQTIFKEPIEPLESHACGLAETILIEAIPTIWTLKEKEVILIFGQILAISNCWKHHKPPLSRDREYLHDIIVSDEKVGDEYIYRESKFKEGTGFHNTLISFERPLYSRIEVHCFTPRKY